MELRTKLPLQTKDHNQDVTQSTCESCAPGLGKQEADKQNARAGVDALFNRGVKKLENDCKILRADEWS